MTNTTTSTLPLPGKPAPELAFDVLGAEEDRWDLRKAEPDAFSLLIFYRGLHCPICKGYLQQFEMLFDELSSRGVELVALSMDTEERARRAKAHWGLAKLPIGYDLDEATVRRWGLYLSEAITKDETHRFSEPGLFLVRKDGTLHYAAINSMPFGRPQPREVLEAIDFIREKDYPPRGRVAA